MSISWTFSVTGGWLSADEEEHSDGSSSFLTFICYHEGGGLEYQGNCYNCAVFCHRCHCRQVAPVNIRKRLVTACIVNETNLTKQIVLDADYPVAMPLHLGSTGLLNYVKWKEEIFHLVCKETIKGIH